MNRCYRPSAVFIYLGLAIIPLATLKEIVLWTNEVFGMLNDDEVSELY